MVDETIHGAVEAGIDPAYAAMLARGKDVQEAEERVGRSFPRSDYLISNFDGFSFRTAFDERIPQARLEFMVVQGPEGSIGIHYNADLSLIVGKKTRDDKEAPLRDKTEKEIQDQEANLVALGKRLQRVLGLETFLPASPTAAGVEAWLGTAKASKPLVVVAGYDKNGFATAALGSVRHPDDPGKKGKKLVPGKTALQVAEEELAKAVTGGGARRTLGTQGGAAAATY
jgi:hypothetical protein